VAEAPILPQWNQSLQESGAPRQGRFVDVLEVAERIQLGIMADEDFDLFTQQGRDGIASGESGEVAALVFLQRTAQRMPQRRFKLRVIVLLLDEFYTRNASRITSPSKD